MGSVSRHRHVERRAETSGRAWWVAGGDNVEVDGILCQERGRGGRVIYTERGTTMTNGF